MEKLQLKGRETVIFLPEEPVTGAGWPIVILHGDPNMFRIMTEHGLLPMKHCLAAMYLSENRIDDFSPWPSPALNERFPDFHGNADDYLSWIDRELLPALRSRYPVSASADHVGMLGQSLGGLLNLYAGISPYSAFWSCAACVSPSSWYPGLTDRLRENLNGSSRKRWYISSGTREGMGHGDRKKDTVRFTGEIVKILRENNHIMTEYWDEGSHHELLADRYERALSWLDMSTL